MAKDPSIPFHVGLTAERVIDAALELTAQSNLFGWSMRDLAKKLNVAPSVVYHHVGGKDLIARRIVERALTMIEPPPDNLPWQDWYRSLLLNARPTLIRYPGTAKWLLMHGPLMNVSAQALEKGVSLLHHAGFGETAPRIHSVLVNNTISTIMISDERLSHEEDGSRDHAAILKEFHRTENLGPYSKKFADSFIRLFTLDDSTVEHYREMYYRFVLETTIAGLESQLSKTGAFRSEEW